MGLSVREPIQLPRLCEPRLTAVDVAVQHDDPDLRAAAGRREDEEVPVTCREIRRPVVEPPPDHDRLRVDEDRRRERPALVGQAPEER